MSLLLFLHASRLFRLLALTADSSHPIISESPMTIIRTDDIDDLLPSEYKDPWPPLSDEEIEERQRQAEWDDYYNSIPDAAERNRNLK